MYTHTVCLPYRNPSICSICLLNQDGIALAVAPLKVSYLVGHETRVPLFYDFTEKDVAFPPSRISYFPPAPGKNPQRTGQSIALQKQLQSQLRRPFLGLRFLSPLSCFLSLLSLSSLSSVSVCLSLSCLEVEM